MTLYFHYFHVVSILLLVLKTVGQTEGEIKHTTSGLNNMQFNLQIGTTCSVLTKHSVNLHLHHIMSDFHTTSAPNSASLQQRCRCNNMQLPSY